MLPTPEPMASVKRLPTPNPLVHRADVRPPLVANFTFVARDITTNKAAAINPLAPDTAEEKALFAEGEARNAARKAQRKSSAHKDEALSNEQKERMEAFLAAGRTMLELPALADRNRCGAWPFLIVLFLLNTLPCELPVASAFCITEWLSKGQDVCPWSVLSYPIKTSD